MSAWKQRAQWFWIEWAKPLLVVGLVLGSFRSAIADWNDVPTGSMKPTILEGDRIFVNKVAYDLKIPFTTWRLSQWADPRRGDVVVLISPFDGKRLVKRVIGIPGDRIEMQEHRLLVNGHAATYGPPDPAQLRGLGAEGADVPASSVLATETSDGRSHPIMTNPRAPAMASFELVNVPAGHYLVMGDNRDNSFDSRWFGFVERKEILGRATAVVLSLDRNHGWWPRWRRFFSPLS
jgi:signal peptidase I